VRSSKKLSDEKLQPIPQNWIPMVDNIAILDAIRACLLDGRRCVKTWIRQCQFNRLSVIAGEGVGQPCRNAQFSGLRGDLIPQLDLRHVLSAPRILPGGNRPGEKQLAPSHHDPPSYATKPF
jgi:hypothetical protein